MDYLQIQSESKSTEKSSSLKGRGHDGSNPIRVRFKPHSKQFLKFLQGEDHKGGLPPFLYPPFPNKNSTLNLDKCFQKNGYPKDPCLTTRSKTPYGPYLGIQELSPYMFLWLTLSENKNKRTRPQQKELHISPL